MCRAATWSSGRARAAPAALAAAIEKAITEKLGLTVAVAVRSGPELAAVVAGQPFGDRGAGDKQLHVAFLSDEPGRKTVAAVDAAALAPDEMRVAGREVYLLAHQLRPLEALERVPRAQPGRHLDDAQLAGTREGARRPYVERLGRPR